MNGLLAGLRQPLAQALGLSLIHFLWQGCLLGLLAGFALWLLRAASARVRYAIACVALATMVALPVVTFRQLWLRPAPVAATLQPQAPRPDLAGAAVEAKAVAALRSGPSRERLLRVLPYALPLWGLGVLLLATRLAGGWAWLQWLRRSPGTVPADDAQQLLLLRLCQRLRLASNIRLLFCDRVAGPTVMGWLKPVVLLPSAALLGLSPDQLEMLLAHELAHIQRYDYLVNLIQSAIEVLLFYHPAIWWLSARIRREREQCCDDLAVRNLGDALGYARALTRLENLRLEPLSSLVMSAHGDSLMHRIQRLLSPIAPTPLAPRAGLLALCLLAAGGFVARSQEPAATGQDAGDHYVLLQRSNAPGLDGRLQSTGYTVKTRGIFPDQALAALGLLEKMPPEGPVTELLITFPDAQLGISGGRFL